MPNWCSNYISISGPKEDIYPIEEKLKDGLTLSALIPMPEQLKGIVSGSCMIDGKHCMGYRVYKKNEDGTKELLVEDQWHTKDTENVAVTDEEKEELRHKYGAVDWYEWNRDNWGTKWDIDPVELDRQLLDGNVTLSGNFDTAWAPPTKWLTTVSRMFPSLTFKLAFAEGGMCYYGVFEVKNGEVIEKWDKKNFWSDDEEEEDEIEGDDEVDVEEGDEEVDDDEEDNFSPPRVTDECREHLDSYGLHTGG